MEYSIKPKRLGERRIIHYPQKRIIGLYEKRMNQEIGLRIQEVRKKKGLSRGDLADMSGISPKFIFQIEKQGFGFSVDTLMQLTRVLETSYDYLLEGHAEF